MSDFDSIIATCVIINVPGSGTERYTSHYTNLTIGINEYTTMQALEAKGVNTTSGTDSKDCTISGLEPVGLIISGLANHLPYASVEVEVLLCEVDPSTDQGSNISYLFSGLVYRAIPQFPSSYMTLECKDRKYYADQPAGIPCTEQCAAPYFGDLRICKKDVTKRYYTIDTVNGNLVTVQDTVTEPDRAFNKGYISFDGIVIGIKYWLNGSTFQTRTPAPNYWQGQVAEFAYGCDQARSTCINIHNNISRFMGAGYGMMDYDPKYSTS